MAIVKVKSDLTSGEPDPAQHRGRPIVAAFTVTNAATDSNGSRYHLVDLPSCAILDARTAFQVQNWGFAAIRVGTQTDVDALVSVLKSAGNVVSPVVQFDAKHGKPLWEVLGLASDPGGNIGLFAHAIADATGAGTMLGEIHYRFR
jgi:hypothetical protein